jgi:hypothetical protein
MEAFGGLGPPTNAAKVRVTSIVDIPDVTPERAQRIAALFTSARMGADQQSDPMSIDVAHDPALKAVKVVMVGSPVDVATMLRILNAWIEHGR